MPQIRSTSQVLFGDLPAEVLTNVFGHLPPRNMITATHICQYWRDVALGCATLWTTLPLLSAGFTELAAERARDLPLSIRVGDTTGRGAASLSTHGECTRRLLCLPQRLKHISIVVRCSPSHPSLETVLSGCTGSAPLLETLHVECPDRQSRIPDKFLSGGTPSLLSIGLLNCAVRWATIPFASTLTHLHLSQQEHPAVYRRVLRRPSIADLVDSLRRTPLLIELKLKNYLPKSPDYSIPDLKPLPPGITLPSLARLSLNDGVQCMITFLRVVLIPKATSVAFEFGYDLRDLADFRRLLVVLDRTWKDDRLGYRPLKQGPHQLRIDGRGHEDLLEFEFAECSAINSTKPILLLIFRVSSLDWFECLPELARQLNFDSLVSLVVGELSDDYILEAHLWTSTFGFCPRLQQVAFQHCSGQVAGFTEAYQCHVAGIMKGSAASPRPWLPALTGLQFESTKFQKRKAGSAASVVDFLYQQRVFNRIDKKISVKVEKCSNFNISDYQELLGVPGVDVEWDGHEALSDTGEASEEEEEEDEYSEDECDGDSE